MLPDEAELARRSELVLQVLGGDTLEAVAAAGDVTVAELEQWRRHFVHAGREGLRS
jgi:hypothetical protein